MATEEKDFLDLEGLTLYDAEMKAYIDKLLTEQAQKILSQVEEESNQVVEFFD